MIQKSKKLYRSILIILLLQVLIPLPAWGDSIYIADSFDDLYQIDIGKTTAAIDTTKGWVTLGLRNMANSLILYDDSYNITVINKDAVQTYSYNGTCMEIDYRKSINYGLTEPISIAGRMGEYIVLDRGEGSVFWYHYDGVGMVLNNMNGIAASLTDARSAAVFGSTYDLAVLNGQNLNWYGYDGIGMVRNEKLSFDIGNNSNPISLSLAEENYTCLVLDKAARQVRRYYYNGSGMIQDETRGILSGLIDPRSISFSEDGNLLLVADGSAIKTFIYDGAGMICNSQLSVANLNRPLAVTIKPGCSAAPEYAVIEGNEVNKACVKYFAYGSNGMEEITSLRVELDQIPYGNDQLLYGKPVTTVNAVTGLRLTAETETPPGTGISWEVTVDGENWLEVTPGGQPARFDIPGIRPGYRAVLHTDNNSIAPRILSVQLTDASLRVRGYADKDCYHAGEAMMLLAETEGLADRVEAVMWWTGGNDFTDSDVTELIPAQSIASPVNTWQTRHNYPADYDRVVIIPKNMPDGEYTVGIRAYCGLNWVSDSVCISVEGSQYDRLKTRLDEQEYLRYE